YLIEASRGATTGEMREFYIELPLNFQKIYEFASQITKAKQLYSFPERWTMQIINGVGGLNDPIPKMDWSDFQPSSAASWNKVDVKNHITGNLLANYIPLFRVYNTREFIPYIYANPITTGIYAQRDLPIGSPSGQDYADLDANFIYMPNWNIYFDISGRGVEGNRITAEQGSGWAKFFSWLGMKRYSYAYDLSYPIVIEINDKTENAQKLFGRDGYKFFFALEANIRDNKEMPCQGAGLELTAPPSGSILCNENQWNSGELTIETVDAQGNPLADVGINYACGNMIACVIGSTAIDDNISSPNYGRAVLVTKLPYPCVGGYLLPGADGYWTYPINYSSVMLPEEKTDKIKIALEKFRSINATIVKKRICKMTIPPAGLVGKPTVAWKAAFGFGALASNEIAQITLEKIKTVAGEEDFSVNIVSEGGADFTIPQIVPGKYKMTGTLIYNLPAPERNNITFADEKICVKRDLLGICTDYDTMHIEPFNESFYEGGIELDNIEIPANYLDDYDVLTFKIISVPDACSFNVLSFSDTEQIGKYGEWATALRADLLPTPGRSKTTSYAAPPAENPLMAPLE
ncbi:MAG: hypothetical protein QXH80_03395, partial [Candidatus Nanoarchaeia archaeon]